jgi:hypothetical protein
MSVTATRTALVLLLLGVTACAFLGQQVAITTVSDCIKSSCKDPDATDYTRCEAACRSRYGQ